MTFESKLLCAEDVYVRNLLVNWKSKVICAKQTTFGSNLCPAIRRITTVTTSTPLRVDRRATSARRLAVARDSVGTGSSGHRSPGHWVNDRSGRVGPRVSVTDPASDPVLWFIHALCCCFWGENTPPWNLRDCKLSNFFLLCNI